MLLVKHLDFSVRIYDGYATYLRVKILPPVSFASFLMFIKMEFGFQGIVLPHAGSVFIYLFIFLHSLPLFLLSLSWSVEHLVWVWLPGDILRGSFAWVRGPAGYSGTLKRGAAEEDSRA